MHRLRRCVIASMLQFSLQCIPHCTWTWYYCIYTGIKKTKTRSCFTCSHGFNLFSWIVTKNGILAVWSTWRSPLDLLQPPSVIRFATVIREYWIFLKRTSLLAVVWFGSSPFPPLPSQRVVSLSHCSCVSSVPSINNTILSVLDIRTRVGSGKII